jgi:hypothetical protein
MYSIAPLVYFFGRKTYQGVVIFILHSVLSRRLSGVVNSFYANNWYPDYC